MGLDSDHQLLDGGQSLTWVSCVKLKPYSQPGAALMLITDHIWNYGPLTELCVFG